MLRPMACVRSLKTIPMAFLASLKYSRGLTRTSAPVGQFSWQEYAGFLAPSGLRVVFSHRLHLIASKSCVSVTAGGPAGGARLSQLLSVAPSPNGLDAADLRGTIVMALYGHCVAQSPHPIHVARSISICPLASRAMAPVGHPVRHSGSWQCRQTDGNKTCWIDWLFGLTGREMWIPRRRSLDCPCTL